MTEMIDAKGKTVIVAIHTTIKEQRHQVTRIASIHGREHDTHFINWIKEGLLQYMDAQKALNWLQSRGLQLPKEEATQGLSYKNIHSKSDLVKWEQNFLFQDTGKKAAVEFVEDGKAIIHAFESADVSSLVHETAHIFRRQLPAEDMQTAEQWAGAENGWTVEAEEKFARGFEKYLREGNAPSENLKSIFEQFKEWLVSIYKTITGTALDVKITPEIKGVFDGLLTTEVGQIDQTRAEEAHIIAAPIKLTYSNTKHISDGHQKEITDAGYKNVKEFVADVINKYNQIWIQTEGKEQGRLVLLAKDKKNKMSVIELVPSKDVDAYEVVTAYPMRPSYKIKGSLLWESGATEHPEAPLARGSEQKASTNIIPKKTGKVQDNFNNLLFQSEIDQEQPKYSDEWYEKNRQIHEKTILDGIRDIGGDVKQFAEKVLTPMSSRLYKIAPFLFRRVRNFVYESMKNSADYRQRVTPFLTALKTLNPDCGVCSFKCVNGLNGFVHLSV